MYMDKQTNKGVWLLNPQPILLGKKVKMYIFKPIIHPTSEGLILAMAVNRKLGSYLQIPIGLCRAESVGQQFTV